MDTKGLGEGAGVEVASATGLVGDRAALDEAYRGLEPTELWHHFSVLNRIPRPSGEESRVAAYVREVAKHAGASSLADSSGNIVVRVPAKQIEESAPVVAVQAHLDMVCEKNADVVHDCSRDPIRPRREGQLIFASGTTLGADNGIGVAAALGLLTEPHLRHGPLELVFTVEEERGLRGALAFDSSVLRARRLINLDSEDPRELVIASAGSRDLLARMPISCEPLSTAGLVGRRIAISGLRGGHSGMQIHERLGNAVKLLVRALQDLLNTTEYHLVSLDGGTARNAIPRVACADLMIGANDRAAFNHEIDQYKAKLDATWREAEPALSIDVQDIPTASAGLTPNCREKLIGLLDELPHGALAMSEIFEGKVKTSCNLARVHLEEDIAEIVLSARSLADQDLDAVESKVTRLSKARGAEVTIPSSYPAWCREPGDGLLLALAIDVYSRVYKRRPVIGAIHAGLECGVIAAKVPSMEAISFGPLIRGAHTPEEHVDASTVSSTWQLLVKLLEELAVGRSK